MSHLVGDLVVYLLTIFFFGLGIGAYRLVCTPGVTVVVVVVTLVPPTVSTVLVVVTAGCVTPLTTLI